MQKTMTWYLLIFGKIRLASPIAKPIGMKSVLQRPKQSKTLQDDSRTVEVKVLPVLSSPLNGRQLITQESLRP